MIGKIFGGTFKKFNRDPEDTAEKSRSGQFDPRR
jgi:hypothetical protein